VDKWWKKLHIDGNTAVQAKRIYSPVRDVALYWNDMYVGACITDRIEVIRKLCDWKAVPAPYQCDNICDEYKGKVIVDFCRLFAMNHNMEVTPPDKEDDHSLEWKALRNITVALQNEEPGFGIVNLGTEFQILEDRFNEVAEGDIKNAPNGHYEYLRRVVLGAYNDDKSLELEKETGSVNEVVTKVVDNKVALIEPKFTRLEGRYAGAGYSGYDVLEYFIKGKLCKVITDDGIVVMDKYRKIEVVNNGSSVVMDSSAMTSRVAKRGHVEKSSYLNLGSRPTFTVNSIRKINDHMRHVCYRIPFVKLVDEIIVSEDGSVKWMNCNNYEIAKEREAIADGSKSGRILQLYGVHITEFDMNGAHLSRIFQRSDDDQYVCFEVDGVEGYTLNDIRNIIDEYSNNSILTLVYKEIKRVPGPVEEPMRG
jgi:hypothetical protein